MEIKPAYHGEALLLRWGDTHNGRTVTLQLDEHFGTSHPFKGLKCGPNGQRMQIICVLIDENEQPVSADNAGRQGAVESTVVKTKGNGPTVESLTTLTEPHADQGQASDSRRTFSSLPRSQQAGIKLQDADFQKWIVSTYPRTLKSAGLGSGFNAATADETLKSVLAIVSKKELDTVHTTAMHWDSLLTEYSVKDYAR